MKENQGIYIYIYTHICIYTHIYSYIYIYMDIGFGDQGLRFRENEMEKLKSEMDTLQAPLESAFRRICRDA